MITVKQIIEEIIQNNDFVEDGLYNNYLNLTSFWEYIKPIIENKLQKEVSVSSIKMTLSRISKDLQKQKEIKVIKKSIFFIKKWISILTVSKTKQNLWNIEKIYRENIDFVDNYFSVVNWSKEINIIYSENIENIIWEIFPNLINKISWLWAIWIYLDDKMLETKWMFYSLTKKLYFNWVNILEITSTYKEIVFFVREKDLKQAIDSLIV